VAGQALDVVFLLDALNRDVMSTLFTFVGDVIERFPDVGRQATRVALMTYAEQPRTEFYLDDYHNKQHIQVPVPSIIVTRKLSYLKDDRAMRPIYGCPGKFQES